MNKPPFETLLLGSRPFDLGQILATRGALEDLHPADRSHALGRHATGDWGDCDLEDRNMNDDALENGDRLLSVYHDRNGTKFWIITEAERSVTTILLPDEY